MDWILVEWTVAMLSVPAFQGLANNIIILDMGERMSALSLLPL